MKKLGAVRRLFSYAQRQALFITKSLLFSRTHDFHRYISFQSPLITLGGAPIILVFFPSFSSYHMLHAYIYLTSLCLRQHDRAIFAPWYTKYLRQLKQSTSPERSRSMRE
ncbi:unnamed protein product [Ectocarpus sp. 4 AP-2014]